MKLLFKQRLFSWFDSYDIYYEDGRVAYEVRGKLDWGHRLEIYDPTGIYIGRIKEEVLTFLPRFAMYVGETHMGYIRKQLTLFRPVYTLDINGWRVEGDLMGWSYRVVTPDSHVVFSADKELFRMTDTYVIDVARPEDSLTALMIVLAIDAARCS